MELRNLEIKLSERELQIIKLMAEGMSNAEIGNHIFISFHTVKAEIEKLYGKFEVHNRIQLIIKAIRLGIISADM